MRARDRDIVAGFLAGAALVLGAAAWTGGQIDPGIRLAIQAAPDQSSRIVVTDVDPTGPAASSGIRIGMVVVSFNGMQVLSLPGWDPHAKVDVQDPTGNGSIVVPFAPGPTPTFVPLAPVVLQTLIQDPIFDLSLVEPEVLANPLEPDLFQEIDFNTGWYSGTLQGDILAWVLGVAIILFGGWWLVTGRGGASLRTLAIPGVVATAAPLLLLPFRAIGGPVPLAASSTLAAVALLPLADGLIARLPVRTHRLVATAVSIALAVIAAVIGGFISVNEFPTGNVVGWWLAAAGVTVVPGIIAARQTPVTSDGASSAPSRRLLESTEFAVLGLTPAVASLTLVATGYEPFVLPILLWILAILLAGRFTVRPLVRLATRAQLQRDLVVATMEAERSRIATNIHDDALQDVTLMVRRFDDAGDAEGAEMARGVADRLRTISGDLRLPILDDLGVGPALDWLVNRTERMAGGEVRLELSDGTRPPADVELAVFRIAQEALTNAVKHGRPPIVVRYRAVDTGVSLSVDDAGPGIQPGAAEDAPAAGHFGILGMSQRAEQIGAILDVRRWPTGGTHVALEWRPR